MNALADFSTKVRHDVWFSCDPLGRVYRNDAHLKHGASVKQFRESNSLLFVDVANFRAIAVDSDRVRVVLVVGFSNKFGRAELRSIGVVLVSTYTTSPNANTTKVAVLDVHQFAASVFGQPLCTLVGSEMQRWQSVAIGYEQLLGQVIADVNRLVSVVLMCMPIRTVTDIACWICCAVITQRGFLGFWRVEDAADAVKESHDNKVAVCGDAPTLTQGKTNGEGR